MGSGETAVNNLNVRFGSCDALNRGLERSGDGHLG